MSNNGISPNTGFGMPRARSAVCRTRRRLPHVPDVFTAHKVVILGGIRITNHTSHDPRTTNHDPSPLAAKTGAAAGAEMKRMNAFAASASFAFAVMPAEQTVICCSSARLCLLSITPL